MNSQQKTVGFFSRFLLFVLLCFGIYSLFSLITFNPLFSGWSYTTSMANFQTTYSTINTYLADSYFVFYGRFAYFFVCFFIIFHFLFLFQRTEHGFSWIKWLSFMAGFVVLTFGLGSLYDIIMNPNGGDGSYLFNLYKPGGFFSQVVTYILPNMGMKFLVAGLTIMIGAVTIYFSQISAIVKSYWNYLRGRDLGAIKFEQYNRNVQNLAIINEAREFQRKKGASSDDGLRVIFLPESSPAEVYAYLTREKKALEALVHSYQSNNNKTPAQQQTQNILERMLERKTTVYKEFYDQIADQSLWFAFKGTLAKLFGRSKAKLYGGPLSTRITSASADEQKVVTGLDFSTSVLGDEDALDAVVVNPLADDPIKAESNPLATKGSSLLDEQLGSLSNLSANLYTEDATPALDDPLLAEDKVETPAKVEAEKVASASATKVATEEDKVTSTNAEASSSKPSYFDGSMESARKIKERKEAEAAADEVLAELYGSSDNASLNFENEVKDQEQEQDEFRTQAPAPETIISPSAESLASSQTKAKEGWQTADSSIDTDNSLDKDNSLDLDNSLDTGNSLDEDFSTASYGSQVSSTQAPTAFASTRAQEQEAQVETEAETAAEAEQYLSPEQRAAQEAAKRAQEEARLAMERAQKAQAEAQEAARRAQEILAKQQAETARRKAELEEQRAQAQRQAELAAQARREEEARQQAQLAAQAEAKRQAEIAAQEEARRQAELSARAQAEAQRQAALAAQAEAQEQAKEEARLQAERAALQAKAEEEARLAAEEAALQAEEAELLAQLEAQKAAALAREEEARQKAEQATLEAQRVAQEEQEMEARLAMEEEVARQRIAAQRAEEAAEEAQQHAQRVEEAPLELDKIFNQDLDQLDNIDFDGSKRINVNEEGEQIWDVDEDIENIASEFLSTLDKAREDERKALEAERELTAPVDPDAPPVPETTDKNVLLSRVFASDLGKGKGKKDEAGDSKAKESRQVDASIANRNLFSGADIEEAERKRQLYLAKLEQAKEAQKVAERNAANLQARQNRDQASIEAHRRQVFEAEQAKARALAEQEAAREHLKEQEAALRKAQEIAQAKAQEKARLQALQEAKLREAEEAKARAEHEARLRASLEAQIRERQQQTILARQQLAARQAQLANQGSQDSQAQTNAQAQASIRAQEEAQAYANQQQSQARNQQSGLYSSGSSLNSAQGGQANNKADLINSVFGGAQGKEEKKERPKKRQISLSDFNLK